MRLENLVLNYLEMSVTSKSLDITKNVDIIYCNRRGVEQLGSSSGS